LSLLESFDDLFVVFLRIRITFNLKQQSPILIDNCTVGYDALNVLFLRATELDPLLLHSLGESNLCYLFAHSFFNFRLGYLLFE
jgi:hypothetical protein